ncbi:hypothetical protein [Microbacterium ulmi]|uniref:Uncharacterized protein n=1 Tax=Microbacterium ulmi TaxID=179095 RepID=A0A7Y2Q0D7_9MICO|nr:hypothetical protein [Microbacterium ulmi]NII68303.1 hypothetical protein [Microbacterium ulmi]NNH03162.1 hypothetical protein [Microbacterium ulmi]
MMHKPTLLACAGVLLLAGGLIQAVGDTVYALDRVYPGDPGFAFANLVAATWHVFLLVGVVAAVRALTPPLRRLGLIGGAVMALGLVLLIAAEVVTQVASAIPVPLIAASAPVTGVGAVLLGVALLRDGGRRRLVGLASLLVGAYALAVLIPTSLGPAGADYVVVAGWGLCWAVLGGSTLAAAFAGAGADRAETRAAPAAVTP